MTALLCAAAVLAWLLVFWAASRSRRLMGWLCDFVLPDGALRLPSSPPDAAWQADYLAYMRGASPGNAGRRVESLGAVPWFYLAYVCCDCGAVFAVDPRRARLGREVVRWHRVACPRDAEDQPCQRQAVAIVRHNQQAWAAAHRV